MDNQEVEVISYDIPRWKIWKHKRYILAILAFMGFTNIYALRTNLSIAIVDMTSVKNITLPNGGSIQGKEFDWSSSLQGYILSSFFYGYTLTQLPGGYVAARIGGVKVFGFGIVTTAIFTLLTPWIAKTNVYLLIAVRALEGAFEGVTYPAMQQVWANWAPPLEKSILGSIGVSGAYFGAVLAMPICSVIATAYSWEVIFYTFGLIGIVWYILWMLLIRETPSVDTKIDKRELMYIESSLQRVDVNNEKIPVPWVKILTSPAVIANTVCLTCEGWGFYTMLTFMPSMMKSLLGYNLNQAGFISALPYLLTTITLQITGFVSDFIISKKYLRVTTVRKCSILIGFSFQAVFLLLAGYWLSPIGTPICLILGVGLGGTALSTLTTVPLDLAPKFASVIFGFNNTIATLSGIVSPILTGYIVTDATNVYQWRIVLSIASGVYFFGVIVCFFFLSGEKQPWADADVDVISDQNNCNDKNVK